MELFRRRSARQRNNIVMRLGCFLVSASMLVSLVLQPPKAKALLSEASLATSVIWAFMQSAGLSFSGNNAGSQAWIDSCQSWYNKFMDTKDDVANGFVGWLGYDSWGDFLKVLKFKRQLDSLGVPSTGYTIAIPKPIASKLAEFTQWFIGELGLTSGGESKPVVSTPSGYRLYLADGDFISLGSFSQISGGDEFYSPGSILFSITDEMCLNENTPFELLFSNGMKLVFPLDFSGSPTALISAELYNSAGKRVATSNGNSTYNADVFYKGQARIDKVGLAVWQDNNLILPIVHYSDLSVNRNLSGHWISGFSNSDKYAWCSGLTVEDLALSSSPASGIAVTQPGELTPPVDDTGDNSTVITLPNLDGDFASINDLLQQILDKLAANDLTVSGSVAATPDPEQPDEETPDLDGLGLPALGAALVTRFPFSIPWDVVKGIKLVAAPAEAPRWEVDFLAPIAHRVGGWKGSTTVVIDMGEYPIIGQVCRWTSMIGFCLILASGTKKLIWTA